MTRDILTHRLSAEGLAQFKRLQDDAARAVADRFLVTHAADYERFGARGREATLEDLAFHLEFLRPVLEFGLLQSMVDYLCWLDGVLAARTVPVEHLALSLQWLAEYFGTHMDATHGAVVAGTLQAARTEYLAARTAPANPTLPVDQWPEAAALEAALLAGDQKEAFAVVMRCMDAGAPLVDVELRVIQPALYRIGERWQANEVSVAQEHMATAIVQAVMTVGLMRSVASQSNDRRVLLACVEGNTHSIGLRMVADAFQLAGWHVQYLGASVPSRALIQHAVDFSPHLVGLSVSFPHHLPAVKSVIEGLGDLLGSARPAVMIGGLAINRYQMLAQVVAADAYGADAHAAVLHADRLLGGGSA
jgi:methanogenic corrinoid protein MtbC1